MAGGGEGCGRGRRRRCRCRCRCWRRKRRWRWRHTGRRRRRWRLTGRRRRRRWRLTGRRRRWRGFWCCDDDLVLFRRSRGGRGAGRRQLVGVGTSEQQRHRHHQGDRRDDRGNADDPRPARSSRLFVTRCFAVTVVVVEVEIDGHIRPAADVFGLRSRVGPGIDIGLARLAVHVGITRWPGAEFAAAFFEFAAAFAGLDVGFQFFGLWSWWIRPAHVCLSCPTTSATRAAPRLSC